MAASRIDVCMVSPTTPTIVFRPIATSPASFIWAVSETVRFTTL